MPEPPLTDRPAVLVADADPGVRRMLAAAFRRWGVTGHFAEDGDEAVEACRQHGPTIGMALVEVALPNMDGPSTVSALRAIRPDLPCWFMGVGDYKQLRRSGALGLLSKPFDLQSLRGLLDPLAGQAPRPMPGAERRVLANHRGSAVAGPRRASAS